MAEIDPHQALSLCAGVMFAANPGEVDLLAFAQRWNFHAGAGGIEAPAVVATRDGLAVETAGVQRDPAVRAGVAQCEHAPVSPAPDDKRLAEQNLGYHAAGPQIGAGERNVP